LGVDLKWQSASLPSGLSTADVFPATSLERIGTLISRVIERWLCVRNSYVYAAGCLTTTSQVIELLETETGANFVVGEADAGEWEREAEKMVRSGWPDAGWGLLERAALFDGTAGRAFRGTAGNAVLGVESEDIGDLIRKAVHEWKHSEKGDCGCS
jgi:hypothetical protein